MDNRGNQKRKHLDKDRKKFLERKGVLSKSESLQPNLQKKTKEWKESRKEQQLQNYKNRNDF